MNEGMGAVGLAIPVVATFLTVYIALLALVGSRESLDSKLRRYTVWRTPMRTETQGLSFKVFLAKAGGFTPIRWRDTLDRELVRADIPLKGGEFLILQAILALLCFAVGFAITRKLGIGLLFFSIGAFLPRFYLQRAQKRKYRQFNNQLADALLIMANSLRAGFSLLQAMDMVSQEMPEPIASEFRLALREMTYGTATEMALQHLSERVGSADLDLLVTAILIQRQVGGNLSEVLQNIHETIQDRLRIQREIRTLTAQGRTSGYLIAMLPFGIAVLLLFINPAYLGVFVTRPIGWALIAGGLFSQLIGFLLIRRIVAIKF
ncbi:MAG: type II secretion system F family protein [Desulfitobacteriaceae bacterium]|nr:type II secretion system F family protein [Desulfitobacteriaceae bacterium]MDI6879368.1 type II secretion system F family protein [Desulfitobacteriaceae bacterium]MDI6913991.1 type II secretion system F family protein [Desulfitobacteriaceae bacterium]